VLFRSLDSNAIVIEIVQALAGSLAVILTVPAVAFVAAAFMAPRPSARFRVP
jgi:uncharacterized membrane protein